MGSSYAEILAARKVDQINKRVAAGNLETIGVGMLEFEPVGFTLSVTDTSKSA